MVYVAFNPLLFDRCTITWSPSVWDRVYVFFFYFLCVVLYRLCNSAGPVPDNYILYCLYLKPQSS